MPQTDVNPAFVPLGGQSSAGVKFITLSSLIGPPQPVSSVAVNMHLFFLLYVNILLKFVALRRRLRKYETTASVLVKNWVLSKLFFSLDRSDPSPDSAGRTSYPT